MTGFANGAADAFADFRRRMSVALERRFCLGIGSSVAANTEELISGHVVRFSNMCLHLDNRGLGEEARTPGSARNARIQFSRSYRLRQRKLCVTDDIGTVPKNSGIAPYKLAGSGQGAVFSGLR